MTEGIKIIPASEAGVTNANTTYLVNDYKGTVGLRHGKYDPMTAPQWSSTAPLNRLSNQKVAYNLPTGDFSVNIVGSDLSIKTYFEFHFTGAGIVKLMNKVWWFKSSAQFNTNGPNATAGANDAGVPTMGKWVAIGTGPASALRILSSCIAKYNGLDLPTQHIDDAEAYWLGKIMKDGAKKQQNTWFIGDIEEDGAIVIDGRPYTMNNGVKEYWYKTNMALEAKPAAPEFKYWAGTTGSDFTVGKFIELKIPLSYVSDIFMQDHQLFNLNAVNASQFSLTAYLSRYDFHHLMGMRGTNGGKVGLTANSGIYDMYLTLYQKSSQLFTADLNTDKVIPRKTIGRAYMPLVTSTGAEYGHRTIPITESRRSVNDIMVSVRPLDDEQDDSCYVHGITTTYKAAEIIKIINADSVSANFNFFYDFNVQLPGQGLLFQAMGIRSLNDFRNLTLDSMGLLNNHYAHASPLFSNKWWSLLFSDIIINCEGFKGDLMGRDVILDGIDTNGVSPKISFAFHNYDTASGDEPPKSTTTNSGYQTLGPLAVDVCYIYDAWTIILPQQNKIVFTEEPERYK